MKSFLKASFANEFHSVLGQYLNYLSALRRTDKDRVLYLAVPNHIWLTKFQIEGIKTSIEDYQLKIIVYDIQTKKILEWIT
ncbi:MAG: element excision factor XisH family protein [Saprospiraceae bacterium]